MYVTWYFAIAAYPFLLTSDSVARRSYSSVGFTGYIIYSWIRLDAGRVFLSHSPVRSRDRLVRTRLSHLTARMVIVMVQSINIMTVKVILMTFKVVLSSVRKRKGDWYIYHKP